LALVAFAWFLVNRQGARARAVQVFEGQAVPASNRRSPEEGLVVVTYNISMGRGQADPTSPWAGGRGAERAARCAAIGRVLADLGADVVILNEVDFDSTWSGAINMAKIIAQAGGYRWRAEQRNADVAFPFYRIRTGNAVLSRFPIVSASLLELPQADGIVQWGAGVQDRRSAVQRRWAGRTAGLQVKGLRHSARVTIALPGAGEVEVWPVHLDPSNEAMRQVAAERLLELAAARPRPVILAGDFNTVISSQPQPDRLTALDRLLADGVFGTDLSAGWGERMKSYPTTQPRIAIDWILATPPLQVIEQRAVPCDLSDHLPVRARLGVPAAGAVQRWSSTDAVP
jgi:endonuclease/exonuclease/phosphatase family metal-dependent hydrolase